MRRLWVPFAWMVLLSFVSTSRTWAADPPKPPLLTKAAQILKLTSEESQRRYPVQIRGVVTFCDFEWSLLFVQDDTAGIYVAYAGQRSEVTAGQRVAVEGNSDQGLYASYVRDARVTVEGPGALPPARPITLAQMLTGEGDSQWVEMAGVVNSATHQTSRSILMLNVENHRVRVTILGLTQEQATRLLDAQVRIRGVCAVISNEQGQVTDAQLFVPSLAEVIVDVAQRGPITRLTAPVRTIREIRLSPRAQAGQAIRIRGVVSGWSPGNWLEVSDPTGTLLARSTDEKVLTNDVLVEVFGKLSWNQEEAELSQANYWRMGVGQPP